MQPAAGDGSGDGGVGCGRAGERVAGSNTVSRRCPEKKPPVNEFFVCSRRKRGAGGGGVPVRPIGMAAWPLIEIITRLASTPEPEASSAFGSVPFLLPDIFRRILQLGRPSSGRVARWRPGDTNGVIPV